MAKKVNSNSRILNCIPSKETERDWRIKHSMNAGLLAAELITMNITEIKERYERMRDLYKFTILFHYFKSCHPYKKKVLYICQNRIL